MIAWRLPGPSFESHFLRCQVNEIEAFWRSRAEAGKLSSSLGSQMRPAYFAIMAIAVVAAGCSTAPDKTSASESWTGNAKFNSMGADTGAFSATLNGSTNAAAPYTIRVHITKGGRILPHTHPDERVITVVDGEL